MAVDPLRYAIVSNEFRYVYAKDTTIAARYKKARKLDIDTNLREVAYIAALLTGMYGVIGAVRRRFELILAGTTAFTLDQMASGPLGVTITLPDFSVSALNCIVTRMVIDEGTDNTILEVWG